MNKLVKICRSFSKTPKKIGSIGYTSEVYESNKGKCVILRNDVGDIVYAKVKAPIKEEHFSKNEEDSYKSLIISDDFFIVGDKLTNRKGDSVLLVYFNSDNKIEGSEYAGENTVGHLYKIEVGLLPEEKERLFKLLLKDMGR